MARLFLQELPSVEQVESSTSNFSSEVDSWAVHANLTLLKVATDLENTFDRLLAPYNLSSGRFTLLMLIDTSEESLTPSDLSMKVGVTQATISGLINGLEKAELVKRELHAKDGRSFVITLTNKGQQLTRTLFPQWISVVTDFWSEFKADERPAMGEMLEKMVKKSELLNK